LEDTGTPEIKQEVSEAGDQEHIPGLPWRKTPLVSF